MRVRGACALVAVAALGSLVVFSRVPAIAGSDPDVRILGRLPEPPVDQLVIGRIVEIDAPRRLLYYVWRDLQFSSHLVAYDLKSSIPRRIRDSVVPGFPPSFADDLTAFDPRRRHLLFVDTANAAVGTVIQRVDVATFEVLNAWDLASSVPGFAGLGITYAPQDDRIYLVGTLSGNGGLSSSLDAFFVKPPVSPPTVVVALEGDTGHVAWIRPIPQCVKVLANFGTGAFIGRNTQDDLYFFCYGGGASTEEYGVTNLPGFTGLVRMTIAGDDDQNDALGFPIELFPVSGAFTGGSQVSAAGLDRPSNRVFVQSVSPSTPGAWAFDGSISAWVGLIAAPDPRGIWLGINERTGHYYIASQMSGFGDATGYLIVSNARMTPPPQGLQFNLDISGAPLADPGSKRIFLPIYDGDRTRVFVLEDNTPEVPAMRPVDYDDLTTGLPEGPGTLSEYSGALNGFGARVLFVGGTGGATSFLNLSGAYRDFINPTVESLEVPIPGLAPGDRGIVLSRVPSLDLRNSGATSSAQPAALDTQTEADLDDTKNFIATTPAQPAAETLAWPYPAAACLDGVGERQDVERTGPGGEANAVCDLAKSNSSATATFHPVSSGPLTIGSTSFTAESRRDPILGAVTQTKAVATGIEMSFPGVGGLSIGRVTATALTVAHGRPGTARVEYKRTISDVSVVDASGVETFACQATCDPEQVADAVNANLGVKLRMDVPPAELIATTRGAFAGVEKTHRDYIGGLAQNNDDSRALPAIQLTINNDSAGKSRLLIQLAAIQANSTYGISLLPKEGSGDDGRLPDLAGSILPPVGPPVGPAPNGPVALPPAPRSRVGGIRGAFLLARSPRDVAFVALIMAVIAGAIATAYRRQLLIEHLEDEI